MKLVAGERQDSTLIDLSVYSKNRNFRILLSSKFKERGIRPLQLYFAVPSMIIPEQDLTYDIFRRTLISCNGVKGWNLLAWPNKPGPNKRRRLQPPQRQESVDVARNLVPIPLTNANDEDTISCGAIPQVVALL